MIELDPVTWLHCELQIRFAQTQTLPQSVDLDTVLLLLTQSKTGEKTVGNWNLINGKRFTTTL